MANIQLRNVNKRFPDGTHALNAIDMHINDGEFFILVGPSGCGKSTLLNMIIGLESISEGELVVDGKIVNDIDARHRNMAMVFQSYALYPHMTVRENIAFPLKIANVPKDEIDKRVSETAKILELTELLERKPSNLSGGQRQRVAMGRAIIRRPAAFLLDEPLSNLDARLRVQMRIEIARLQKKLETTTVYVTHDQTEAMTLGDRVAVMNKGVVQQIDTPQKLYEAPENVFVAGFIGSPSMNFVTAKRVDGQFSIPALDTTIPQLEEKTSISEQASVIIGMRPEHLFINHEKLPENNRATLLFQCQVELVECLGADSLVHCKVSGDISNLKESPVEQLDTIIARVDPSEEVTEGQLVTLGIAIAKLHFFDSKTGDRLKA